MKKRFRILLALVTVLTMVLGAAAYGEGETEHPLICISIRDYGDIYAELYPEYAPLTVQNFLNLVGEKFYDGLTFHRIINGFMIQGGDPLGNGTGGSSEKIKGEFSQNGIDNPLKHDRGVLSMARSSDMDSASSQFFIMHAEAPHLDGSYAAFGRVLCGMPAVDRICTGTPVQDQNGTVAGADQPVIEEIRVAEPQEAQAAMEQELAGGRAGAVYQDPYSSLSFPVAEGWNLAGYPSASTARFEPEADPEKSMDLLSVDLWAIYSDALTQHGYTRDALDLKAMVDLGLLGLDLSALEHETREETDFYEATLESGRALIWGRNGGLYQAVFHGAAEDPLFTEVKGMLDQAAYEGSPE